MSDLYVALIYLSFIVVGLTSPFVLTIGYMWVDTFYPQDLSTLVGMLPASMVMAVAAIGGYIVSDRRSPPRFSIHTALTLIFAVWITLSTFVWPEVADLAVVKWDWAFKVVLFSIFVTFAIRSRVQIEAFLQVFLAAMLIHMMTLGVKTLISGSAYGRGLGIIRSNFLLTESSTLATASIALIPIMLYFIKHSLLIPESRFRTIGYFSLTGVALFAAIGTYARTALIGFVVVVVFQYFQSKRKLIFVLCAVVLAAGVIARTASSWEDRIETTVDYDSESSAFVRLLVWQWTLGYVSEHPLGGGFNNYVINRIIIPPMNGVTPPPQMARAYHSIYFEMLGEQGFPGLIMYLTLVLMSLWYSLDVVLRTRKQPHLVWLHDLALALMTSLVTYMACGAFIGIGYQAEVWYMIVLPICLREYLHRVQQLERAGMDVRLTHRGTTAALIPDAGFVR